MDRRSLPPVPIKDTAGGEERRGEGCATGEEGVGGLGGSKSADNVDTMREIERDRGRANTGSGTGRRGEAMMGKKEEQVRHETWGWAAELCRKWENEARRIDVEEMEGESKKEKEK